MFEIVVNIKDRFLRKYTTQALCFNYRVVDNNIYKFNLKTGIWIIDEINFVGIDFPVMKEVAQNYKIIKVCRNLGVEETSNKYIHLRLWIPYQSDILLHFIKTSYREFLMKNRTHHPIEISFNDNLQYIKYQQKFIYFTTIEFVLFRELYTYFDKVLTYSNLLNSINPNLASQGRANLYSTISRIRSKIKIINSLKLHSVYNVGYKLEHTKTQIALFNTSAE